MARFDWKAAVGAIAPGIATALGGPGAGIAIKLLADSLLGGSTGDPVADEAKIAGVLSGGITPEIRAKLIDADREIRLRQLANEAEALRAQLADAQNARARDIELARLGRRNTRANVMVAIDAVGLVLGLAGMLSVGYIKATYPEAISEGVFGALVAQLATITSYFGLCLRDAHQFEFGSSRGSREKDEMLAKGGSRGT